MGTSVTAKHYPFGAVPAGYDANLARQLAPGVAEEIHRACGGDVSPQNGNCYGYSRAVVERFQRAAGTDVDGLYGPYARSALEYYGVAEPPRHLFRLGDEIPPYHPPSEEVTVDIDVPGPGGGGDGGGGGGGNVPVVEQAGFGGLWGAIVTLATATGLWGASLRGRFASKPVEFAGHRRSRKGRR